MEDSKLEKLLEGTQYAIKLRRLNMGECTKLESIPTHVRLKSLEYLNLRGCIRLRNFPQISFYNSSGFFWSELTSTISYLEQASSSSPSPKYDAMTSFHGPDVPKTFDSHLYKELNRKSITLFYDQEIERSQTISPLLASAISTSTVSIVVFSKNYAASMWCLDELVQIHKRSKNMGLNVFAIYYDVSPWEVRKQTGRFGKIFKKTCERATEDEKERWMHALSEVAGLTGEHLQNWHNEQALVGKVVDNISRKLIAPSNRFGELVRLEAHIGNEFDIRKRGW
ncbi:hypothetical protein AXX17_AT4G19950 [Arabidopsis thaliana]|uniref:TIR domain-containing protein n=1 Tax=Arabidopsis thaliana TaxID=3702 RepID=A0A178V0C9_ARATH|nr:hypothetical protein AXX17_AT4G19950 [Arabidopsis thaliana]